MYSRFEAKSPVFYTYQLEYRQKDSLIYLGTFRK